MAYTVTTNTSYGQRLGGSFKKIVTGLLLLVVGTVLLFWNEGRTVKTAKMLKHASKECVHLPDPATVDPAFDGKMVHVNGFATTDEVLTDSYFGVFGNAVKIIRNVEYYQWVEHSSTQTRDKIGGGQETTTTYTYSKEWVSSPVNSSSFADPDYQGRNSVLEEIPDETQVAKKVTLGAYTLPAGLIAQMNNDVPFQIEGNADFGINKMAAEQPERYHVRGNMAYIGKDMNVAEIGDVRISFSEVLPGEVSILSKVVGSTFEPYKDKNGYSLSTLVSGTQSMENMFETEKSSNKAMAWILRILGIILVYVAFKSMFEFLVTLLKVLPFLATIMNLGVSVVCGVLTAVWCLVVIALGWLWYRPVLGILLLAAAVALIWYFSKKGKEKAAVAAAGENKAE